MTQDHNSYLFLKRLVVTKHMGGIAYDELFHEGVNIIRGRNSSGKSTISNLIFYVLGGDFKFWNQQSLKCHSVFAEVEINNAIYTLKREITTGRPGMGVYWGPYYDATKDLGGWKYFPYALVDKTVSFSNVLFGALSFPMITDGENRNINMNQILRLMYIDQDSPTQLLYRFENFDTPLTRQAISELLMGVYDDSLYQNRLDEKNKTREKEELEKEYTSQVKAFQKAGVPSNIDELQKQIAGLDTEIIKLNEQIDEVRAKATVTIAVNRRLNVEELQDSVKKYKQEFNRLSEYIYDLDIDIVDSRQFIDMLTHRVGELDKSIVVRKSLGELSLTYCPECLTPLDDHEDEESCFLCKKKLPQDELRTHAKRLKQELELQIKESKMLLVEKESEINRLRALLPEVKINLVNAQRNLDKAIQVSQTTRDQVMDTLLIQKGGLERQITTLNSQLEALGLLEDLKARLAFLEAEIREIKISIQNKEGAQYRNIAYVKEHLQRLTLHLLIYDLPRQAEFRAGHRVDINFYDDSISLDGASNFSASSNIYFKNSVRFALFFASLQIPMMRYPRFILCDNMEDKGMEKERTQNFQKLIVGMSEHMKSVRHQIIFSTSMIAEELENPVYCVGEYYDEHHKTLKV